MKTDIVLDLTDDIGNECKIVAPHVLSTILKFEEHSSLYKVKILYRGNSQVLFFKERDKAELAVEDISKLVTDFHKKRENW